MVSVVLLVLISISSSTTYAQKETKKNANAEDNLDFLANIASSFVSGQNSDNLGGMISNFLQSDGGQQLGNVIMGMAENKNGNQILETLGSLVTQSGGGSGFDPSIIGNILSAVSSSGGGEAKKKSNDQNLDLMDMLGGLIGQNNGGENLMSLLPTILNAVSAFGGDEAQKRADSHKSHSWMIPPILERLHVVADQFINSEFGKSFMKSIGTEKFVKVFADPNGKFSLTKFLELLENHSFRKHWIELFTRRISGSILYVVEPETQNKLLTTARYFINTSLKSQGFPKSALFDPSRPVETISSAVDYFFAQQLNMKVSAKQYVRPAADYVQELVRLARKSGKGMDSKALSHKLADTINLEIIEPVARVYRAYRFAKKVPQCDKYVMCLVNKFQPQEPISLPGLKSLLSKSTSVVSSWFLSGYTKTSFWTLYSAVMEDENCEAKHLKMCDAFHVEELKVTTEYSHNEL